jgi:branched-chain amino acid aminotransferase
VVYLDAQEHRWLEELGGMNVFLVLGSGEDAELVTPELSGTLLPGITRDSLITLARERGHRVAERKVSLDEWRSGVLDGSVTETFACGTAAVITPIGEVKARTGDFTVGDGTPGPVAMGLRAALLDIQHGRVPDTHGWLHRIA